MKLGLQAILQVKVLLSLRPRTHMKVGQNQLHKLDMHGVICVPSAPHIHIIQTIHNKRKVVQCLIKVRIPLPSHTKATVSDLAFQSIKVSFVENTQP